MLTLQVEVERGMSFEEALEKLNKDTYPGEGFYTSKRVRRWAGRGLYLQSQHDPWRLQTPLKLIVIFHISTVLVFSKFLAANLIDL